MVVEDLQNEHVIKKGAGVDRPNTLQWLSSSHKDEVLTFLRVKCQRNVLTLVLFRPVPYIETLEWLFH